MDFFYLNTNEKTIPLEGSSSQGNTWVGVSALFNFNAVSQLGSHIKFMILIDHNYLTIKFLSELVSFMSREADRHKVINFIKEYVDGNNKSLFSELDQSELLKHSENQIGQLINDIKIGASFLSSDVSYKKIHDLAKSNSIRVVDLDLTNDIAVQDLKEYLKCHNLIIDILYISNIGRRIVRFNGDIIEYLKHVAFLADSSTYILDSWLGADRKLYQRFYPVNELHQKHLLNELDHEILQHQRQLAKPKWCEFHSAKALDKHEHKEVTDILRQLFKDR